MPDAPDRPLTPGKVKRLLDAALASAPAGALVVIEAGGVRVSVRKESAPVAASGNRLDADAALDAWERQNA